METEKFHRQGNLRFLNVLFQELSLFSQWGWLRERSLLDFKNLFRASVLRVPLQGLLTGSPLLYIPFTLHILLLDLLVVALT